MTANSWVNVSLGLVRTSKVPHVRPLVHESQGQQGVMRRESSREREEECQGSRRHPFRHQSRPTRENARAPARTLFCSAFSRCTFSKNDARYLRYPFGKKSWRSPPSASEHQTPDPRLRQFQWANDSEPSMNTFY